MDQLISHGGGAIDRAVFQYLGGDGDPATLIEVIDDTRILAPAPAPIALLAVGLLALAARGRTRG